MHDRINVNFSPRNGYGHSQYERWNRKGQKQGGSFKGKKTYRNSHFYRAQKRMDGQDIYGNKINVNFSAPGQYPQSESNNNYCNANRGKYYFINYFI